ncbi:hypothetical protein ACQPW3_36390 [Actinosynnema sp. CA-248983]
MSIKVREYAVTLRHNGETVTVHALAFGLAEAKALVYNAQGAWWLDAAVETVKIRPICAYCDARGTRLEDSSDDVPLCDRHAKEHYGSDWRRLRALGIRSFLPLDELQR